MKKLRLNRTTLRVLENADLDSLRGALPPPPDRPRHTLDPQETCQQTDSCHCLTTITKPPIFDPVFRR